MWFFWCFLRLWATANYCRAGIKSLRGTMCFLSYLLTLIHIRLSHHALIHCCFSFYPTYPEMEFLDINLTKDSSLLLHAINSPFYWRILKKTILFSGLKNACKKSAKQENSSLFINSSFSRTEKLGRQKLESEKTRIYAQKPRITIPFKNSISTYLHISESNLL